MLQKFQNHIQLQFPFLNESKFFIAVSGGIDSMVLVDLFRKLQYDFSILHCNFQLRGEESESETQFLRDFCKENQIHYILRYFDTNEYAEELKLSTQLAARELRYNWFQEKLTQNNYQYLLTAHHLDDQVETFLINFTRGTGVEGLTGIPSQNGSIIRPLLPFSREEIESYAKENQISWREDSSNASNKYLRNKLRHDVIPIMKELNPSFLASFQNTLSNLKETNNLSKDASKMVYEKVVEEFEDNIEISIPQLLQFNNYKSYLYQWLNEYGFTSWKDIYDLVTAQSGKQVFSDTHIVLKDREKLIVYSQNKDEELQKYFLNENKSFLKIPLNISLCKVDDISITTNNIIFVDEDKIQFPLELRKKQEGDYFYPSGMKGKKKLSKYFKDEKYSLVDKEKQWILTSNNEIIWVIGKRADERYLATKTTQNILKIELSK